MIHDFLWNAILHQNNKVYHKLSGYFVKAFFLIE